MDTLKGLPAVYECLAGPFRGGMGCVYQVLHRDWGECMALKQPLPDTLERPGVRERFVRECELWVSLGLHEHLVLCHYVRSIGGVPTVFAQWMDGGSLQERIDSGALYRGLEEDERAVQLRLLDIAIQMARGLAYAHAHGLVHRDLKPGNVMFTGDGTAKLTDFGLSALFRGRASEESRGFGTLAYAPPEQQNGSRFTPQSDLWSFGVVLLELFLGERLWRNCIFVPQGLESYFVHSRVRMPETVRTLVEQCCQSAPLRRPESAGAVEEQLLRCWQDLSGSAYPRPRPGKGALVSGSWNNRALSFLDLDKPKEALRCWDKALRLDPGHMASVYNRSLFLWRRAELDDRAVLQCLQNAYNAAPVRTSAQLLARFFMERGSAGPIERLNRVFGEELADPKPLAARERREQLLLRGVAGADCSDGSVLLLTRGGGAQLRHPGQSAAAVELNTAGLHLHQAALTDSGEVWATADEGLVHFDAKGARLGRIPVPEGRVLHLALFGESALVHAQRREGERCKDYYLRLSLPTGERLSKVRLEGVTSVPFLPLEEGRALLLRAGKRLLRLELECGRVIETFSMEEPVQGAVLNEKRNLLAAWDEKEVRVWSLEDAGERQRFAVAACQGLCFARRDSLLLCTVGRGQVQVRELATGRCVRTFPGCGSGLTAWDTADAFLSWGAEGALVQHLPAFRPAARAQLSRVEDERQLTGDALRFQSLIRSGAEHWKRGEVQAALDCLASARAIPGYGRNGAYLRLNAAVGRRLSVKGLLSAWLRETVHSAAAPEPSGAREEPLRWSRDGEVRIVRRDGTAPRTLRTGLRGVTAAALSPDGQWVALGCQDGRMALLRASDGVQRWQRRGDGTMVTALAFLPRGNFLLSGRSSGALLVCEGAHGRLLRVLTGHSGPVRAVTCTPDGLLARTDGEDGQVQIWQFDYEYSAKKEETT